MGFDSNNDDSRSDAFNRLESNDLGNSVKTTNSRSGVSSGAEHMAAGDKQSTMEIGAHGTWCQSRVWSHLSRRRFSLGYVRATCS